jgi:hypothetical protein
MRVTSFIDIVTDGCPGSFPDPGPSDVVRQGPYPVGVRAVAAQIQLNLPILMKTGAEGHRGDDVNK